MLPKLEPTYRVLLGETKKLYVMLVGVGGTGSALALSLGRIAYHLKQKGIHLHLTFVDPDGIEQKNLGRQLFAPAEVGQNKAEMLALRLNFALGLDITAMPAFFDQGICRHWTNQTYLSRTKRHLLISAVDNYLARQQIADAVAQYAGNLYTLDLGNEHHSGQILIGNETQADCILVDKLGLCTGIPSPYLQEPLLLEPPPPETDPESCADLTLREEQSLIVNQQVAAIGAQYCCQFLVRRELTSMSTYFTLNPPVARSTPLTKNTLTSRQTS
jgi:PRTRC genetic system ThiF family protein